MFDSYKRAILVKKKWKMGEYRNENWVKILSDSYKRAILVRKNSEKWGNIEMKIGSNFEPRLNCPRALHYTLLIFPKDGEERLLSPRFFV